MGTWVPQDTSIQRSCLFPLKGQERGNKFLTNYSEAAHGKTLWAENSSGDLGIQGSFEVKPNVNFLVTTCHGLSRAEFLALLPIKHIMLWIFKAGLCLWVFLKWQMLKNPPLFCWILERGPVYLAFPDLFLFHCLEQFRSVSSITAVNHSTGNIWSPTVHSLFLVNVLSIWALFQENCGRV